MRCQAILPHRLDQRHNVVAHDINVLDRLRKRTTTSPTSVRSLDEIEGNRTHSADANHYPAIRAILQLEIALAGASANSAGARPAFAISVSAADRPFVAQ